MSARILEGTSRTRLLVHEAERVRTELADLEAALAASRRAVQTALQDADAALALLHARVAELQALPLQVDRARVHVALEAHAEALGAVARLRRHREECLPRAAEGVDAARAALALAASGAEGAARAAAAAAQALDDRARAARADLQAARAAAEAATAEAVRRSAELREVVAAQLRALERDLETARADHRRRFERLVQEVRGSRDAWSGVQERFAVGLAGELTALSRELDQALEGLRPLPEAPRRLADRELFAATRKLRETFEPLAHVEQVWKRARA